MVSQQHPAALRFHRPACPDLEAAIAPGGPSVDEGEHGSELGGRLVLCRSRRAPRQEEARMIYLHETHEVIGGQMDAFEHALRAQWVPLIERDGDAKLLWFWHHTHGTGP